MNPPKRTHSPAESERCTKVTRTSYQSDTSVAAELPAQQRIGEVQITVRLRSASKAARNDPIPADYWEKHSALAFSGRDAGDGPSTSSEDSRATSCPRPPPTPVQPNSSTAPGRPEPSVSLGDSRPHGDGPIAGYGEESSSDHSMAHSDEEDGDNSSDDTGGDEPDADEDSYDSERSSLDEFAEWEWMEQIDGVAKVDHKRVADCNAKLIRRAGMRGAFWVEMEEPSRETSDLAFELFDRYGCLNREYYEHEIRKGSGAWEQELDHGDILLFESLSVEPLWRHQGIGTKIVNAILDKVRTKSSGFSAFARPGYLTRGLRYEDEMEGSEGAQKLLTISKHFWRSLGFRRVGTSGWLAFTDDNSHPSRHLDVAQDWDEPERSKEEPLPDPIRTVLSTLSDPSASDVECVRQIQEAFPVEADAPSRLYTDERGNTTLHIAAVGRKTKTISYILAKYPLLTGIRNAECHTPLEALQSNLEEYRTRRRYGTATAVCSDKFEGFSQSDIACLAALTGTEIFDLAKLSNQDISAVSSATDDAASRIPEINTIRHTLRLKYGCTCGECIGGFLSPRMHFALLCQAEYCYDMLDADLDASGSDWVAMNEDHLGYLAAPVRQNLKTNKSMRGGFTNMCNHIARCLKERRLPDEETVLQFYRNKTSEWPPVTKNYLQRGGTVAAVATMLFDKVMNWDEWAGNGMHLENHKDEIEKLPVCRNDREFGFVSGMCGYKRISAVRYVDCYGRYDGTAHAALATYRMQHRSHITRSGAPGG